MPSKKSCWEHKYGDPVKLTKEEKYGDKDFGKLREKELDDLFSAIENEIDERLEHLKFLEGIVSKKKKDEKLSSKKSTLQSYHSALTDTDWTVSDNSFKSISSTQLSSNYKKLDGFNPMY